MFFALIALCTVCSPDDDHSGNGPSGDDPLKPKPVVTTTISGVVVDEAGKPVSNTSISIMGESFTTDEDGGFLFQEIQVPGNRCVVSANKEGYFPAIRAHEPKENGTTDVRLVLMAKPVTHTFDANSGVNASIDNGSEVKIAPGSLVTSSGESYGGQVSMSVRYLDPAAGNFGVLVPGGDMLATREDESTSVLYSYGILRVSMTADTGTPLQLAEGTTSQIIMDIPDEQLATAPISIPLWYFDEETGVWVEDGSATKEGDKYIGTVTHFTDWNCDAPTEGATIIGRLIDCNGNPVWGQVEFGQIASDPQSFAETGESDGKFSRRVPDGVSITVVISDPLIISPLTQNERGKVIVVVPPLAPGQVYDVGDIQTFPCPVTVKATIETQEGDGVNSIVFATDMGVKNIFEPGETLNTTLPPDQHVVLTIYTNNGVIFQQEIETPGAGEELDLGLLDLTGNVTIGEGVIIKGKTVCFGEPENEGQISVSWQDESGTQFNYTIPEQDGSFEIEAPVNTTVIVRSSTQHGTWENTVVTDILQGQVFDLGTVEICEHNELGETGFIIDGDGYEDVSFTIVQNINFPTLNAAIYYPSDDLTIAYATDMSDDVSFVLHFSGNETGERAAGQEMGLSLRINRDDVETIYWAYSALPESSLSVTVTKFEEVGGVIEGTFSGKLLVSRNGELTGETVTVSNGKFSVLRYGDGM